MHTDLRKIQLTSKLLLAALLLLFTVQTLWGQTADPGAQDVVNRNQQLIAQFAQLGSIAINPYLAIFLTALFSKFGWHNDFVATNPIFDSWTVVAISGVLFLFTAIIKLMGDKVTGALRTLANYLDNKAALVIAFIIIIAPGVVSKTSIADNVIYEAGVVSIPLQTLFILVASFYFLIVVMSVRLFIEILIFLSPIPIIDTLFEIAKIIITILFVLLSIFSPTTMLVLSIFMFIGSLLFFKKARRFIAKIEHLVIAPVVRSLLGKETSLWNQGKLETPVLLKYKTRKFKKGTVLQLIEKENEFFLVKRNYLVNLKEERISFADCFITQTPVDAMIQNETRTIGLILNKNHHKHVEALATHLNIPIRETVNFDFKGKWGNFLQKFTKNEKIDLKSTLE